MTPTDIIYLSLKDVQVGGVGQAPAAEDVNDAFNTLNMMLGQWAERRFMIYHLLDVRKVADGSASYAIGIGQAFNVPAPDRLEGAFLRSLIQGPPSQVDWPLRVIQSREDYSAIPLKSQVGVPQAVFYDVGYPVGTIYPWPIPPSGLYEIHLLIKDVLPAFSALNQQVTLPPAYLEAIRYNLDVRLAAAYGVALNPSIVALAKVAIETINTANAQVPLLKMPAPLARTSRFNIYTGDSY